LKHLRAKHPYILLLMLLMTFISSGALAADIDDCRTNTLCSVDSVGLSAAEIEAYPEPDVQPLLVDTKLLYDRYYQQITDTVDIFDNPNGNVIAKLDGGFNFVTSLGSQDGWTQINDGQWIKSEYAKDSSSIISEFSGVLLPDHELPYPMAWVLVNLYPSRTPGGEPDETFPIIWRYTRVNLFSSVELDGEIWYQIGVDEWVHQFHVAKVIPMERPTEVDTDLWISLDLYEQVVTVYQESQPIFATLVATGLERWPTREGVYHIYYRHRREDMSGGKPGDDFYYLEEVPWTMFFDEGRALHGAYWHDGFGFRRSHGCVNLSITDAYWLYQLVAEEMGSQSSPDRENGPAVYIHSTGTY
jgi:hypothetical protein